MSIARIEDQVSVRRPPHRLGLETTSAHYVRQTFKPHAHDEYLFGVVEAGVHSVWCRGEHHLISAGTVVTMHPGEVHFGGSGDPRGWHQRMIYIAESVMSELLVEADRAEKRRLPEFRAAFHHHPDLARSFAHFHEVLHSSHLALTRDVAIESIVRSLTGILAPTASAPGTLRCSKDRMSNVVDYLHAHVEDNVTLADLCSISGMRQRRTIEAFKRYTGLPPHAYHLLQKINAVKKMLRDGRSATEAAMKLGFADQSHMTRHFVAIVGMTPGAYARA